MAVVDQFEFEDVEGLRVGRFTQRINTTCYVFRVGETLIDTGPPNQWKWIRDFIRQRNIRQVLITHHHEDHSGNGAGIQQELGIPVYAPPTTVPYLKNGYKVHLYRRIVWGNPARYGARPLPPQFRASDGWIFKIIPTPGHSQDMHCVLVTDKGWLFTGDLYISHKPQFSRAEEKPLVEIDSLRKILEEDFQTVFCGHRGMVENGRAAIGAKQEYLESLKKAVDRLRNTGKSVPEIRNELLGNETPLSWFTGFHFSKKNLIASLCR